MTKYEIVKNSIDHKCVDKYYEGITDYQGFDEVINSYNTREEALEALKKYKCTCYKYEGVNGWYYNTTEYAVVEVEYDENGEFIDFGGFRKFAKLGTDDSHYHPEQSEIDFVAAYENTHPISKNNRVTFKNINGIYEIISFLYDFNNSPSDRAERDFLDRLNEGVYELDIDVSDVRNHALFKEFDDIEDAFIKHNEIEYDKDIIDD